MLETKEISDLTVLGRVAPDSLKNSRITYWIGGWSKAWIYRTDLTSLKTLK